MTMVTKSRGMVDAELARLAELEEVIERGLQSFVEVGNALIEVKAKRLFKLAGFDTFDAYCEQKFCIRSSQRVRLMTAAATHEALVRDLTEMPQLGQTPLPTNEAQIRPLTTLPTEDRAEAWVAAVEHANGQPTAADVRAAVDKLHGAPTVNDGDGRVTAGDGDTAVASPATNAAPVTPTVEQASAAAPTSGGQAVGEELPPAPSPTATSEHVIPDAVISPKSKTRADNRDHDISQWAKHLRAVASGWEWFMRINDMPKSISGDVFDRLTEEEQKTLLRIERQLEGVAR